VNDNRGYMKGMKIDMRNVKLALLGLTCVMALPLTLTLTSVATAQGAAPFAGGKSITTEEALKEAPKDDPSLAPLAKTADAADAVLQKHPKDPKAKATYVDAEYKLAHTIMLDRGKLKPKVQYRAALAAYRRVLKVEPKHAQSIAEKKEIEDIYQTMPGGIPK